MQFILILNPLPGACKAFEFAGNFRQNNKC